MKTNYKEMRIRYELAHTQIFSQLPKWKQIAIQEELNGDWNKSRLIKEFVNSVIVLAEDMSQPLIPVVISKNNNHKKKKSKKDKKLVEPEENPIS